MKSICFSLVLYKHAIKDIAPLLDSVSSFAEKVRGYNVSLCVYDGSPQDYPSPSEYRLKSRLAFVDLVFEKGENIGFGRANNRNFLHASLADSDLFLVVNPDISFSHDKLMPIVFWTLSCSDCACVAPLVLLEDGSIQYSAKHSPTFLSLLLGFFRCLRHFSILREYDAWHRNLHADYASEIIESSYLSGCFLLIPAWAFACVGGFCEKYFLHVEDADLVRRLSGIGKTLHNPMGVVNHRWARGSHTSASQIFFLLKSYLIYCSIWGIKIA